MGNGFDGCKYHPGIPKQRDGDAMTSHYKKYLIKNKLPGREKCKRPVFYLVIPASQVQIQTSWIRVQTSSRKGERSSSFNNIGHLMRCSLVLWFSSPDDEDAWFWESSWIHQNSWPGRGSPGIWDSHAPVTAAVQVEVYLNVPLLPSPFLCQLLPALSCQGQHRSVLVILRVTGIPFPCHSLLWFACSLCLFVLRKKLMSTSLLQKDPGIKFLHSLSRLMALVCKLGSLHLTQR